MRNLDKKKSMPLQHWKSLNGKNKVRGISPSDSNPLKSYLFSKTHSIQIHSNSNNNSYLPPVSKSENNQNIDSCPTSTYYSKRESLSNFIHTMDMAFTRSPSEDINSLNLSHLTFVESSQHCLGKLKNDENDYISRLNRNKIILKEEPNLLETKENEQYDLLFESKLPDKSNDNPPEFIHGKDPVNKSLSSIQQIDYDNFEC